MDEQGERDWRDKPVHEERDKDIKDGGMERAHKEQKKKFEQKEQGKPARTSVESIR